MQVPHCPSIKSAAGPGTVHGRSIPLLVTKLSVASSHAGTPLAPLGQCFRSLEEERQYTRQPSTTDQEQRLFRPQP